jgi:hypothetical protein
MSYTVLHPLIPDICYPKPSGGKSFFSLSFAPLHSRTSRCLFDDTARNTRRPKG